MNKRIKVYLEELQNEYDKENVNLIPINGENKMLDNIPKALHELYAVISKAELPFGYIYPIELAIEKSKNAPFNPNWFVFGQDNFFSFWLCSYEPNSKGLSFTSWDHECMEIGSAVNEDIVSFLKDMENDFGDDGYVRPFE